jgi:hypothetical protein
MISFGASLLSYLLVFFIFIVAVVAAIVIGAFIAKARAKKKEAENINQDDEYSDTASDDTPIQIG